MTCSVRVLDLFDASARDVSWDPNVPDIAFQAYFLAKLRREFGVMGVGAIRLLAIDTREIVAINKETLTNIKSSLVLQVEAGAQGKFGRFRWQGSRPLVARKQLIDVVFYERDTGLELVQGEFAVEVSARQFEVFPDLITANSRLCPGDRVHKVGDEVVDRKGERWDVERIEEAIRTSPRPLRVGFSRSLPRPNPFAVEFYGPSIPLELSSDGSDVVATFPLEQDSASVGYDPTRSGGWCVVHAIDGEVVRGLQYNRVKYLLQQVHRPILVVFLRAQEENRSDQLRNIRKQVEPPVREDPPQASECEDPEVSSLVCDSVHSENICTVVADQNSSEKIDSSAGPVGCEEVGANPDRNTSSVRDELEKKRKEDLKRRIDAAMASLDFGSDNRARRPRTEATPDSQVRVIDNPTGLASLRNELTAIATRVDSKQLIAATLISTNDAFQLWRGHYHSAKVAIKRFVDDQQPMATINHFASQIQVAAQISHPNVVSLIGVEWGEGTTTQAVFEWLDGGDLRTFLDSSQITTADTLAWSDFKCQIAIDVVDALQCVFAHRGDASSLWLTSRKVLLDDNYHAKVNLVRCADLKQTRTSGAGRWLAPEVIHGERMTEHAVVYSVGVLLWELDTTKVPFADAVNPNGSVSEVELVLTEISRGSRSLTFSDECPEAIASLGRQCLSFDRLMRPPLAYLAYALREILKNEL